MSYNKLVEKGRRQILMFMGRLAEANFTMLYNTEEAERWYEKALATSTEDSEMIYNYAQMP